MGNPKVVTVHSIVLPTFKSDDATPLLNTAFTLSWTIPNYKRAGYTQVLIDCAPNYSEGPGWPDGGKDVTAQNNVDASGDASGSFQATVQRAEEFKFTLKAQGGQSSPMSTHLSINAGGPSNITFTLNGQTVTYNGVQWKAFYGTTLASGRPALEAHLAGMKNWRDALNQLNGIDSTMTTKGTAFDNALDALKRAGKAIAGAAINAFGGNSIMEPNYAYNTTHENLEAALSKLDGDSDGASAQAACDALTAAQTAMNAGIDRMAAFDTALQVGGQRAIVAIGVVKDAALIALSVTPAGLGASALQAAVIAAGETAVEKGTQAALDWQHYTPAKFASDCGDVVISFASAYFGGKAADGSADVAKSISAKLFRRAPTAAETNTVKTVVGNVVTDYCNNLGNSLSTAVKNYNTEGDWNNFVIQAKSDVIWGSLPPELRAEKKPPGESGG